MRPKFLFCFALVLGGGFFGCSGAEQPVFPGIGGTHSPCGAMVFTDGTLYGTTSADTDYWKPGGGAVFKVKANGKGFAILHHFAPVPHGTNCDGSVPMAGLVRAGKTLYGTTSEGGAAGCGTIFKVDTDGRSFTVLHSFKSGEGVHPLGLVLSGNRLYGTTQFGGGGTTNGGVVFKVDTDGADFAVLHTFGKLEVHDLTNNDGAFPHAGLVLSSNTLYGTTWSGGIGGRGTIYKVNIVGSDFSVLHSFSKGAYGRDHLGRSTSQVCNRDGAYPEAGLILWENELYGTASAGGDTGNGTIFKIATEGIGFTVLHGFAANGVSLAGGFIPSGDGSNPRGLVASGNTLYGLSATGGKPGQGTVFTLSTDGNGFSILHHFGEQSSDGAHPEGLIWSGDALYGVAISGGKNAGGTVFKMGVNSSGVTILHSFLELPLPGSLTD